MVNQTKWQKNVKICLSIVFKKLYENVNAIIVHLLQNFHAEFE